MGFKKTKGTKGEAAKYITRNQACKKLQLKLPLFRTLCILKGIYPREPKSRKRAQKGDTSIKILYLKKDIEFLANEPIISKMREEKIYNRKLAVCRKTLQFEQIRRMSRYKPTYSYDHLVLERYPTFRDALQELDDALSSIFLYASMAKDKNLPEELTLLCKRLCVEFLLYCIQSRCLRKVFVTIKGYYYRAVIQGEEITWVIPHPFRPEAPKFVDLGVLTTFIKFYTAFMGFVNYKLFQSINMHYPCKLADPAAALPKRTKKNKKKFTARFHHNINVLCTLNANLKIVGTPMEEDSNPEMYDLSLMSGDEEFKKGIFISQTEQVQGDLQKKLFEGKKFFLGRETNRESLTFVIRCAGGLVSWDESADYGSTFTEDDPEIAFQVADRPQVEKKYLSRYYIQPQWVYDSFNAGIHMPVQKYFVGVDLPPHLSPFDEEHDMYRKIMPEELQLQALKKSIELVGDEDNDRALESSEDEEETGIVNEDQNVEQEKEGSKEWIVPFKELSEEEKAARKTANRLKRIQITKCKPIDRFDEALTKRKAEQDFRLAATFIHRRQKRLFKRILSKERAQVDRMETLKRRRQLYEIEMKKRKRETQKIKVMEAIKAEGMIGAKSSLDEG